VDKTLILNNLELPPYDDRGKSYDASGKGKAAGTLTGAAQASGSGENLQRRSGGKSGRSRSDSRSNAEKRNDYRSGGTKGKGQKSQAEAPPPRSVTLVPAKSTEHGKGQASRRSKRKLAGRAFN
jgi:hypothetical protein